MILRLVPIQVTQSHKVLLYFAPSVFLPSLWQPHKHSNQPPSCPTIHIISPSLSVFLSLHHRCCFSDLHHSLSRILFSFRLCCLPRSADFSLFVFVFFCYLLTHLSPPFLNGPFPSPRSCLYFLCCCTRLPPSTDPSLLFFNVGLWTLNLQTL